MGSTASAATHLSSAKDAILLSQANLSTDRNVVAVAFDFDDPGPLALYDKRNWFHKHTPGVSYMSAFVCKGL
jgi:hypothetical protein